MKKSIVVLSALLLGLSYCLPGSVVMAMNGSEAAAGNENIEAAQVPSLDNENPPVDQMLSADNEDLSAAQEPSGENKGSLAKRFWKKITGLGEKEHLQENPDSGIRQEAQIEDQKLKDVPESEVKNLQIPEKFVVVIDPWEMDGKGQVYSETYIIRNTGDSAGILTFSNLTCKPLEQSGVVVKTDKKDVHDSDDKNIYMEMLFGNRDRIIFTPESSQYQAELKPGEDMSICFSGEVNENAFREWTDQDVAVTVVYSWERKEELDDLMKKAEKEQTDNPVEDGLNGQQQTDTGGEKSADCQQTDASRKKTLDQQPMDTEDAENQQKVELGEEKQESNLQEMEGKEISDSQQTDVSEESINMASPEVATPNVSTQPDTSTNINAESIKGTEIDYRIDADQTDGDKDEIKNIELRESKKIDVNIDSWKIDEKGRIVSPQYLLYNAGDNAGTWKLSELICIPWGQSEVKVTADKKNLYNSKNKTVYMELVLGNGEHMVLSQESSTYEVKLESGEKLAVRFIGEMNGNLFESREEGDIVVTAAYSWNRD